MNGMMFVDYLQAAFERAEAKGWKREAKALYKLYSEVGAAVISPDVGDVGKIKKAHAELAAANPRLGRVLEPHVKELIG